MSPELSQPSHSAGRSDAKQVVTNACYSGQPNEILAAWNRLDPDAAAREVLPCCGSQAWAYAIAEARPFATICAMQNASDEIWLRLSPADWDEAFASHPRIGAPSTASSQSAAWSDQEQEGVTEVGANILEQLARANAQYEQRFGRTYIVCATAKSAEQMLEILQQRLQNGDEQELLEAAEQQRQITQIRLKKWLTL